MAGIWVVYEVNSGYSDESMRIPERLRADAFIAENEDPDRDKFYDKRWESDSPHPRNEVAVGQVWRDGKWLDFARDTPEAAIAWAQREPVGLARVVDWIGKSDVIWP